MKIDLSPLFYEMEFSSFRSSGPGGQNVNKTNSAVSLRWNISNSNFFNDEQKTILLMRLSSHLTKDGDVLIRSSESRQNDMNKSTCIKKFFALLTKALQRPKIRRVTRPTRSSIEKRVHGKKERSKVKSWRKKVSSKDY